MLTVAKLQTMRRLLLGLLAIIEKELCDRGALQTINARDIQHW